MINSNSITFKVSTLLVVISAIFILLTTLVSRHLFISGYESMEHEKLNYIMHSISPSLALNLSYGFNEAVTELGNELIAHKHIVHVQILPHQSDAIHFGISIQDTKEHFTQEMTLHDPATKKSIATFKVFYSKKYFHQLMQEFYILISISIFLYIIALTILILFLLKSLKPLGLLANMMNHFNPKNPKTFHLPFNTKDEISSIGMSANSMVASARNYLSTMQELNKKLYQNEAHLKEAQRMAHVGSWEYNISNNTLELSAEMYRILALKSNTVLTWDEFLDYISSSDKLHVNNTLIYAIEHGSTFELKYSIVLKNSNLVYIHTRGKVRKKEAGHSRMAAISMDVTAEHTDKKTIEQLAFYDPLTKLPNRTLLNDRLSEAISNAKRHKKKIALLFLDLDHFKNINDTLGHDTGDSLLIHISKLLKNEVRESDTLSRIGGDEFVILLTDIKSHDDALVVTQKLIRSLHGQHKIDQHLMYITTSIGVAMYPDHGENYYELIKHADTAMYAAKEDGRNTAMLFTKQMSQDISKRRVLENDIQLMEGDYEQFELYYQPKIDAKSNKLLHVEALIRWRHPTKGLIFPDEFIHILEESGLILKVGEWIIESCFKQIVSWRQNNMELQVAINLSAAQFQDYNLIKLTTSLLEKYSINPLLIEFEITENISINNVQESLRIMQAIKSLGICITLDDFGTGYSSLSYLKQFPIDVIKIDKSFVMNMHDNHDDFTIVKTIINMAQSLNFKTVAEGVETTQHAKLLKELHCDMLQGYFYAKPLPVPEFNNYYNNFLNQNE
ncbi:MAG: EAL domain-containing protein [Campylobacterota bacterium]|nr:EAL domain-containing protein [Campylobacterota bacterium]